MLFLIDLPSMTQRASSSARFSGLISVGMRPLLDAK